jgi:hypothetical protein
MGYDETAIALPIPIAGARKCAACATIATVATDEYK